MRKAIRMCLLECCIPSKTGCDNHVSGTLWRRCKQRRRSVWPWSGPRTLTLTWSKKAAPDQRQWLRPKKETSRQSKSCVSHLGNTWGTEHLRNTCRTSGVWNTWGLISLDGEPSLTQRDFPFLSISFLETSLKSYLVKHSLSFLLFYHVQGLLIKIPTFDIH